MRLAAAAHLVRRSLRWLDDSRRGWVDDRVATLHLSEAELALWSQMQVQDRAHALRVLGRFVRIHPLATEDEIAAVLLHDVGKIGSRLGFASRAAATLLGPRTRRWRSYLDHERIGASMLRAAGSPEETCRLVAGEGDPSALSALRAADEE